MTADTTPDADLPQIYLITPTEVDLNSYPDRLAACLDAEQVACVRLSLATRDEDRIGRTADAIRAVTSERDVALVIERHVALVARHGLDGVHLLDGARSVRAVRKDLGEDAIIGTFCGQSRHDGMTAGELNADYVSFGPVGETALDDGSRATLDLFDWWSQMIEVPVVAEGALDVELIRVVSPHVDFFALGDEIWRNDDPAAALRLLMAAMS
ncbi:thiamine-phosphate pyrophosphorylase [Loktanella fryxellensis]|uniref:Thiamine-phosphate pyrophosphorylase n=1 Tax=Loktanella fryxellensis TaxID=245187 RepID=A0A1H8F3H6_9RHOB|nr:thiamine phosphate synthase [Loktanella fryxellensis]SEN26196.1 thiamine-phosphate pyrophosphorylase [Loktanella fryxellensis]